MPPAQRPPAIITHIQQGHHHILSAAAKHRGSAPHYNSLSVSHILQVEFGNDVTEQTDVVELLCETMMHM